MRLFSSALLVLACASASTAPTHVAAQTQPKAQIALTILGGAISGHSLWDIPIQPVIIYDNSGATNFRDTVHLRREVGSSIVVGASATYFFSRHLAVHAEISYAGLPFDDSCTGTFNSTADTLQRNRRACNDIQSRPGDGGAVSIFTGATYRFATGRALTPYIRGNVGILGQPHSSVEMVGSYLTALGPQPVRMVVDPSPRRSSILYGLSIGVTTPVSKRGGYQFRIEARDLIASFERVTGQADAGLTAPTLIAPTKVKSYHHLSLTLGLDVVLEQTRGRRY